MATLTVQAAAETGGHTFSSAASGGDVFANDGRTLLVVNNASGGSLTVTVAAQNTSPTIDGYGPLTKGDGGGAVAAGATGVFGPFPTVPFNNASGQAVVTYSGVTSLTVAAIKN